jgi:hypothetical protein
MLSRKSFKLEIWPSFFYFDKSLKFLMKLLLLAVLYGRIFSRSETVSLATGTLAPAAKCLRHLGGGGPREKKSFVQR